MTAGNVLIYSYTLLNNGAVALTDVTLSDDADPALTAAALAGLTDIDGNGADDDLAAVATATATRSHVVQAVDVGTTLSATAGAVEIAPVGATVTETISSNTVTAGLEAGIVTETQG